MSADNSQPEQSPVSFSLFSTIRQLGSMAAYAMLALVILGAIIRCTIRDSVMLSGVVFYATPPAMMVLLLIFVWLALNRKLVKVRRFVLALLLIAICWTARTQWVSNPSRPSPSVAAARGTCKVMFWNVCEGKCGWGRVLATIQQHNPDVIALAEADHLKQRDAEFFAKFFPGYQRLDYPRRLMLLSRLPIRGHRRLAWVPGCVVEAAEIETETATFTLVMSDVASNVFSHRKPQIEAVKQAVNRLSGPVVIVGDLNTPVGSLFFDSMRSDYVNAFESNGYGLHTTWPMPLPVMAIDHMWGSEGIKFQQTQILWTTASDHRPIVADLVVESAR